MNGRCGHWKQWCPNRWMNSMKQYFKQIETIAIADIVTTVMNGNVGTASISFSLWLFHSDRYIDIHSFIDLLFIPATERFVPRWLCRIAGRLFGYSQQGSTWSSMCYSHSLGVLTDFRTFLWTLIRLLSWFYRIKNFSTDPIGEKDNFRREHSGWTKQHNSSLEWIQHLWLFGRAHTRRE